MTSMDLLKSTGMLAKIQTMIREQSGTLPSPEAGMLEEDTNKLVLALCNRMDQIYTEDEVYKMVLFYNTDLGKTILSKQDAVLIAMQEEMTKFFENFFSRLTSVEEAGLVEVRTFN